MSEFFANNKKGLTWAAVIIVVLLLLFVFREYIIKALGAPVAIAKEKLPERFGGNPKDADLTDESLDLEIELSEGSSGPEVEQLQIKLNDYIAENGWDFNPLIVDGEFGTKTLAVLAMVDDGSESIRLWELLPEGSTKSEFRTRSNAERMAADVAEANSVSNVASPPKIAPDIVKVKSAGVGTSSRKGKLVRTSSDGTTATIRDTYPDDPIRDAAAAADAAAAEQLLTVPYITRTGGGNAFLAEEQAINNLTNTRKLVDKDGNEFFVAANM